MNHTISISAPLYAWLQEEARKRGLMTIEELLESWKAEERELRQRREVVGRIKAFQQELRDKYGELPDSTELIREDRER